MKTHTTYEIMLRHQDASELIVDVRETIEDHNGEEIAEDYTEGFSFEQPTYEERYSEARRQFNRLFRKYGDLITEKERDRLHYEQNTYSLVENDELLIEAKRLIEIKEEEDGVAILTVGNSAPSERDPRREYRK